VYIYSISWNIYELVPEFTQHNAQMLYFLTWITKGQKSVYVHTQTPRNDSQPWQKNSEDPKLMMTTGGMINQQETDPLIIPS